MVHKWYICVMIEELKKEVEKVFGQVIQKRSHCEGLAQELYTKTGIYISYNTIRRMYGLIDYREPRVTTLDAFSKYIGFSTYKDFTNRFNSVDEWSKWENLFLGIDEKKAEELVSMFHFYLSQKEEFPYFFTVLLRELIYRRDLNTLKVVLSQDAWSFANLPYEMALKIGVIVGRQFRFIQDEAFENELLKLPLFRDLVLKMFVDYSALNKKYGRWISYVNQLPNVDDESKNFTNGVMIWKDLLNGQSITAEHLARIPVLEEDMHPILYGRVSALHLMACQDQSAREKILRAWGIMIKRRPERTLEYVFVANVQCLVFPTMEFSNFLHQFEKHASKVHFWYNESQLNVYYLSIVQHAIFTGHRKKALDTLNQIDLSYLRYGYDEFLRIFTHFFQYELTTDLEQKHMHWQRLMDHAAYLNYPIFTDTYFKDYFSVPRS
jgi:hypothetical protein